jgi:hypothetical protein
MVDIEQVFEKYENDLYSTFDQIENKLHHRPDMCAFLYLEKLVPGKGDMIACAEHDQIWLDVDCEKLAEVATEDDIKYLIRCGVWYESDTSSLSMWA